MPLRRLKLAVALIATGSTAHPAMARPFESLPPDPTPAQACANLAQAKYKWDDPAVPLPKTIADLREAHGPDIPPSERMISLIIDGGMGNEGPMGPESIVAWLGPDAVWHVSRVFHSRRPPDPPEYPAAPKWPEPAGTVEPSGIFELPDSTWDVEEGEMTGAEAAALDAMLAAPCFDREPASMPVNLPLRHGPTEYCVPDSASWSLLIRDRGTARGYGRPCRLLGPVGAVIDLITSVPLRAHRATLSRKDLYAIDERPTADGLHAFLAHALPGARWQSPDMAGPVIVKAYRQTGPCTAEITGVPEGDPAAAPITFTRDWTTARQIDLWPDGATARLYFKEDNPDRVALGGTVAALKVEGAAAWLPSLCKPPK